MRTCKETIDAYFQVKFKASLVSASGERARAGTPNPNAAAEPVAAAAAVNKFAALGTYLANLRDDTVRARYTELNAGARTGGRQSAAYSAARIREAVRAS